MRASGFRGSAAPERLKTRAKTKLVVMPQRFNAKDAKLIRKVTQKTELS